MSSCKLIDENVKKLLESMFRMSLSGPLLAFYNKRVIVSVAPHSIGSVMLDLL